MTDIFEEWKKTKFIVADYELLDQPEILVVLTDYKFWADHLDELKIWCENHKAIQKGMTVGFNTQEDLAMFVLRWS